MANSDTIAFLGIAGLAVVYALTRTKKPTDVGTKFQVGDVLTYTPPDPTYNPYPGEMTVKDILVHGVNNNLEYKLQDDQGATLYVMVTAVDFNLNWAKV